MVALSGFVCQFETAFASIAYQLTEAEKEREYHTVTGTVGVYSSPNGQCVWCWQLCMWKCGAAHITCGVGFKVLAGR